MSTTPIRDDNLRLLFAGPAQTAIAERISDIKSGARLLVAFITATSLVWLSYLISGEMNALTGIVLFISTIISLVSPIIFAMLTVEYRRAKRDQRELLELLTRYKRI